MPGKTTFGGSIDAEGALKYLGQLLAAGYATGLAVSQRGAGANMSVDVSAGGGMTVDTSLIARYSWITATENVAVSTANPTNPRKDIVVMYVDTSLITTATTNNDASAKFLVVAGTAAASPVDPSDSTIQTAVGAGRPWIKLARIDVAAAAANIVNANITDLRTSMWNNGVLALLTGDQTIAGVKTFSSTPSVPDSSWTTRKIKPTTVQSSFVVQGARFTTSSTSFVDVTACSFTYTAGPTNERLFLHMSVMAAAAAGVNNQCTLNAGGTDLEPYTYHDGATYSRQSANYVVDVAANAAVTIKLRAKSPGGVSVAVVNDQSNWMPKVTGFAISNV